MVNKESVGEPERELLNFIERKISSWYKNIKLKFNNLDNNERKLYLEYREFLSGYKENLNNQEIKANLIKSKVLCFESPKVKALLVYEMKIDKYIKELKYNLKEVLEI
jgi:hypothetical protein